MLLRDYRPEDLPRLHVINEGAYPGVASETIEKLGHICDESVIRVIAEIDGEIAGFCLALAAGADYDSVNFLWFGERYGDFVYLDRVAVDPAFKRRGVGRAMYAEVERLIAERCPTAEQFTLEVNIEPRNDESLAFHHALGFVEVGQQDTDYGTTVSLMTKPLPAARR
jgi:predicted GNAT superfamily acetyltransferase